MNRVSGLGIRDSGFENTFKFRSLINHPLASRHWPLQPLTSNP